MRLLFSPASPFSAKVRMTAHQCGILLEESPVDTRSEPDELTSVNPLGKIPVLMLDGGEALYDSAVICEYLDRSSGNLVVPQTDREWLAAKRLEATADGVMDAAILSIYEVRYRPEDKRHAPWVEMQWRKAARGIRLIEAEIGDVPQEPHVGHFAVVALIGWLELRFPEKLDADFSKLKNWSERFFEAFPTFAEFKPRA